MHTYHLDCTKQAAVRCCSSTTATRRSSSRWPGARGCRFQRYARRHALLLVNLLRTETHEQTRRRVLGLTDEERNIGVVLLDGLVVGLEEFPIVRYQDLPSTSTSRAHRRDVQANLLHNRRESLRQNRAHGTRDNCGRHRSRATWLHVLFHYGGVILRRTPSSWVSRAHTTFVTRCQVFAFACARSTFGASSGGISTPSKSLSICSRDRLGT